MLMTSPFWIAATAAETYSRVATMMFWGMLTPATEFQPKPVEVKQQNEPQVDRQADRQAEPLPLAA